MASGRRRLKALAWLHLETKADTRFAPLWVECSEISRSILRIFMYISCNCANITNNAYFVYVQEDDKQSGEGSYVCHCCYAKEGDFLSEVRFALNSVESRRRPHNLGYDAFPWEMIVHGNCWEYRRYSKLAVLPDKVSRYLFEFNSQNYTSLNLPAIPYDEPNIHCLMTPEQIQYTLHIMCV